jgi:hypothetical protein
VSAHASDRHEPANPAGSQKARGRLYFFLMESCQGVDSRLVDFAGDVEEAI